jgi:catechol 2,3-dioxygenase-like lactoylglutathione lyase family enzyme
MSTLQLWYANIFVTDLKRAVEFYQGTLGLPLQFQEEQFGYASPVWIRTPVTRRGSSAVTPASGGVSLI